MAASGPWLARLLQTPDLAKVVPALPPEVLHRVIQICGLEDAAEVVALATPAQLSRILDVDVWSARTAGADERFDVDRFGTWLEVLMQSGPAVAAEKLIGLDIELVVTGLSRHVAVFDQAAAAWFTTLDGEEMPGRVPDGVMTSAIGGYAIEARRTSAWDAIIDLLTFLRTEHSGFFGRVMRGCVRLSSGPREADGFHTLLGDSEQDMFNLASDRQSRRELQGYVTPAEARAFLEAARHVKLHGPRPPVSPLAQAYFRDFEPAAGLHAEAGGRLAGVLPESQATDSPAVPAAFAEVLEVLRDAGALTNEVRGLLGPATDDAQRLTFIRDHVLSHPASMAELAYLANAMVAGCSILDRPFAPEEASNAVVAICNLGLEAWPQRWTSGDLIGAFQVGWTMLHRDVSIYAAKRLIAVIAGIKCDDRDTHIRLQGLRRELAKCVRGGTPWRARDALEVLVMLDASCWAALAALTDECPVLHAAIRASRDGARSVTPSDYEFISELSQITVIREFMDSLHTKLTP